MSVPRRLIHQSFTAKDAKDAKEKQKGKGVRPLRGLPRIFLRLRKSYIDPTYSYKGVLVMRPLIAIAFLLMVGIVHSQEPPKGNAKQQKAATEQRGTEKAPIFVKTPGPTTQVERDSEHYEKLEKPENERRITSATVALAWITGFLAFFTFGLWIATYRLVKDAKDTAKNELRAYVGIQDITVRRLPEGIFQAVVTVVNGGRTPAYSFRRFLNVGVFDATHTSFGVGELTSPMPMAPNTPTPMRKVLPIISQEDVDRVSAPHAARHVFVWGRIEYKDIFKVPQHVTFRFMSREIIRGYSENAPPIVMGWALHPADDGNDAT